MVLATHDLNLAASLCDTLVLLRDGRVLAHGADARRADAAIGARSSTTSRPTSASTSAPAT